MNLDSMVLRFIRTFKMGNLAVPFQRMWPLTWPDTCMLLWMLYTRQGTWIGQFFWKTRWPFFLLFCSEPKNKIRSWWEREREREQNIRIRLIGYVYRTSLSYFIGQLTTRIKNLKCQLFIMIECLLSRAPMGLKAKNFNWLVLIK